MLDTQIPYFKVQQKITLGHGVWKSQKKSHSTLRVKFIKNAKNGPIWRVFENLKFAVKQYSQTGQF